ncbi:MAG: sterol desaturase family protein [Proteobacteria bacterium]|nr:sterol desaturase family protein [Pseudomonadota bacterium]
MGRIIVLVTPLFFLLIGVEYAWGRFKGRSPYRLNDAINSISLGMLSQFSAVFLKVLNVGIYAAVFGWVAVYPHPEFWNTWYGWLIALLLYDFCYYWLHRLGHRSAVLWAAHVVHHQSQDYNLSTALRQTSSGALLGWVFYLPMALVGVPPLVFAAVALIDLLYQFWVHTELIPKLGWFDRWFCAPSNHRVHHAVNDRYLDKNFGGILIVWDRLFGSYQEETEPCVYGTRAPLESWDPLWANVEVYWSLLKDSWRTRRWGDKLLVWFKPPGWRPDDLARRDPKPAFDLARVQRFHPPASRLVLWLAALQFLLLLGGATRFLWFAERIPLTESLVWLGVLVAGLWAVGALLQGHIAVLELLMVDAAALAAAGTAVHLPLLYQIGKPLPLALAVLFVVLSPRESRAERQGDALLVAALLASLTGDVLLMLPDRFVPGLAAFLFAHLCYLALFQRSTARLRGVAAGTGREVAAVRSVWFPSRRALLFTLGVGAAAYAYLWHGIGPGLRVPVAAYVLVIALMAAQAIGRALLLGDRAAALVAVGAVLFMASDTLLAVDRFARPLPLASLWVLATYYAAQILIAHNARAAAVGG